MLVLLRSTDGCNMRCSYCYGDCGQPSATLSLEDCSVLLKRLRAEELPGAKVEFIWHGGEPSLLGTENFEEMLVLLNRLAEEGIEVTHRLQSNGLALDQKWADLFAKYRIGVGISLDGPGPLHDYARRSPDGAGTYDRICQNIRKLREAGVAVSLLCTLGPQHLGRETEIVSWLDAMGLAIKFNPLFAKGRSSAHLPLDHYYHLLRGIFTLLLKLASAPPVQPFEWMLRAALYQLPPNECSFSGNCGENIFAYGNRCDVGICTRDSQVYGNLKTSSLAEIRKSSLWRNQTRARRSRDANCENCSALRYCNGGCPVARQARIEEDCAATRDFFAWLAAEGLDLYRDALVSRRKSLSLLLGQMKEMRSGLEKSHV